MENLFLGIAILAAAVGLVLLILAVLAHLIPFLIRGMVSSAALVNNGLSQAQQQFIYRVQAAWTSATSRIRQQRNVNQILNQTGSTTPGPGINQRVVQQSRAEGQARTLFNSYSAQVKICVTMHHYMKDLACQSLPIVQEMSEVMDDQYLASLRDSVVDNADACIAQLGTSGLAHMDETYAKIFVGLRFLNDSCGANCPFWHYPIANVPRLCGPAQFIGMK